MFGVYDMLTTKILEEWNFLINMLFKYLSSKNKNKNKGLGQIKNHTNKLVKLPFRPNQQPL